jgi:single-stranded-DNA-specific exonuclease
VRTRWVAAAVPPAAAELARAGRPRPLAELLALRGVETPAAAARFLHPSRERLGEGPPLPGLPEAAARLADAVRRRERVVVVGDYDVDGVSSCAMLGAVLRSAGGEVEIVLPRRDGEGYGLQPVHVRRAVEAGAPLLVALDSGTHAPEAWEECARRGVELIVVDHHLAEGASAGERVLLVNPRLGPDAGERAELTAAGLALHLCARLLLELGREVPWEALLRVACLGTIADVAPLVGENRVIAALGLAALGAARSPGLQALIERAGVHGPVRAADVAFRLAPRLNAAGRLARADEALELLLTRDRARANELVELLERRNAERQRLEQRVLDEALEQLGTGPLPGLAAAWSSGWHRGVVGVAAARLARETHRPAVLLAVEESTATGSGRSVAGLPLHELLRPFAHRMLRFGGHAQAVGLTVESARLGELGDAWRAAAGIWLERLAVRELRYDLALEADAVGPGLLAQLAELEPFGAGNAEPVFRFGPLRLAGAVRAFGRGHLGFAVAPASGGRPLAVVDWRGESRERSWLAGELEILAVVERDRYEPVRLRLVDGRPWGSEACD